ncbi:hypothetical protein [Roseateles sp.]|uniref:hypothetical protein n=1 Tax=Roseateles sp. TaxID=1971397 RepID=UPI00395E8175
MPRQVLSALVLSLVFAGSSSHAQSELSAASALSGLPIAVSAVGGLAVSSLVAGMTLVVVGVETVAGSTVWVLERASDGARVSLTFTGKVVGSASTAVGAVVTVSAVGAGTVLSVAGRAIAFVPNEIGKALLHHEKLSR